MPDTSSNPFWQSTPNYQSFEMRSHRFRREMLSAFYTWLGITPESIVLDGGCGTGVFTRYLAAGLTTGHITGFDINKGFIDYGRRKARELNLADKMTLEVADGFDLPFPDNGFDAVTNYTYVGVLSDPEAGLKELVRVCKPGGVVSCVIATNSIPQIGWQGGYPFDGAGELQRLTVLENRIFSDISGLSGSLRCGELELYKSGGLTEIHMYPFSHLICYTDTDFPFEYRNRLALDEAREEIDWLRSRFTDKADAYAAYGFSRADFDKLVTLLEKKYTYLSEHFETDNSYEWHGGFNIVLTGRK